MQTVETTVLKEAKRCRLAQFCGQPRTLEIGGSRITGLVRSVQEATSGDQRSWIVTIIPSRTTNAAFMGEVSRIRRAD